MLGLSGGEAGEERSQCRHQEPDGADAQQVHYHRWISFDDGIIQLDQAGEKGFFFICLF